MQYCVITSDGDFLHRVSQNLSDKVAEAIKDGWKVQGGVSISRYKVGYENYISMAQAMVKEK